MNTPITDIHLHPTLKPYGHSFYQNENKNDLLSSACIWHPDPPTNLDELEENILGFPPYRECDFTTMVNGRVNIAVVSLYPMETGFVNPQLFKSESKELIDLITLFGRDRIAYLQSAGYNYFTDLNNEYNYLLTLNKKNPINGIHQYELLNSGAALTAPTTNVQVFISIEGAHVFCNGHNVEDPNAWTKIEERIEFVKKNWEFPPFFITFCHHFYNGLASHAQSLFIKVAGKDLLDQSYKLNQPIESGKYISTTGYKVIDLLYSQQNGKRILIDIKHMAKNTRQEFYAYRKGKYDSIPLICSHGALIDFYSQDINLNLEDIKEIYQSEGLIGIELDQRILGYNQQQEKNRFWNWLTSIFRSRKSNNLLWAEYFWKNIIAIAEQCYDLNVNADPWKLICLGSDFDGIINPLNKFRTSTDLQALSECILKNLIDYWGSGSSKIPINHLGIDAHTVVYNIMYKNAKEFISKNY